jgi:phosphatidate cytidylyltransferase
MDWEGNANYSTFLLLLYFLLVFGNDTFAYIFGMAFGKNNRGVLKVSPNKSIAGFIGGTVVTTILSVAYCMFIDIGLGIVQSVVLGVVISFSANVGDLVESAFKRAAEVKDSGHIVPGRGGFLDSIDSLLASAPVFWVLFVIFRA